MQEMVASVSDITRIARVFTDIGGWRERRLPDAPREQWRAWRVPRGVTRIEQRLLIPAGDDRGCVRLVRFHGARNQRIMRSSGRTWDTGGIFDIDVYASDARVLYRKLQAAGWSAYGDPAAYSWAGFDVVEVVATGPDGLVIAMIEPKRRLPGFPRYTGFSRVFNSAQMVADHERTKHFYTEVLGWRYTVESVVQDAVEPGQLMLGLPLPLARDVVRKIGIAHPPDATDGSAEPIAMPELGGVDFSAHCVAPNLGWLCARYRVDDLGAWIRGVESRGGRLHVRPVTLDIAAIGRVRICSIRTPDAAILEFYELLEPAAVRKPQSVARRPRVRARRSGPGQSGALSRSPTGTRRGPTRRSS